jgi:hypothetical protein
MHAFPKAVTYAEKLVAAMERGSRMEWCNKEFKTDIAGDTDWEKKAFFHNFHIFMLNIS